MNLATKPDTSQPKGETAVQLFNDWLDPIERYSDFGPTLAAEKLAKLHGIYLAR